MQQLGQVDLGSQYPGMDRSIGLAGATSIGVGAIVGGGILALAGVAFSVTGPSAVIAFAVRSSVSQDGSIRTFSFTCMRTWLMAGTSLTLAFRSMPRV